jgi:hypothetical protein
MIMILTGTLAYGQKCKYEYQKTDELSGKASKAVIHELSNQLNLRFKSVEGANGNVYTMDVLIYFTTFNMGSANTKIALEAGDSISIKLSTGEIVSIYSTKQIIPDVLQDKLALYQLYENIPVDERILEKLSEGSISYVCLCNEKKIIDGSLKEKEAKALQDKLKCILQ